MVEEFIENVLALEFYTKGVIKINKGKYYANVR